VLLGDWAGFSPLTGCDVVDAQYLFNERLLQAAAAVVHDCPSFPSDIVIPASVSDICTRPGASFNGRNRRRRRDGTPRPVPAPAATAANGGDPAAHSAVTEPLLGGQSSDAADGDIAGDSAV